MLLRPGSPGSTAFESWWFLPLVHCLWASVFQPLRFEWLPRGAMRKRDETPNASCFRRTKGLFLERRTSDNRLEPIEKERGEVRNDHINTIPQLPNGQDLLHRNPCPRHCRVSPVLPKGLRLGHQATP